MAQGKKSAIGEIFADEAAGRLDFLHARTLAFSVAGEMEELEKLVEELATTPQLPAKAHASAQLRVGVGLWIMGKYAEGCTALESVHSDPDGAYFGGLCLMETGDYDKALKRFEAAAKAGQDEFVCAMSQADALRRAGRRDGALEKVRACEEDYDGEAELHYQKGCCLEEALDYEAAMEAYERAVELNPQHVGALFRLAYWHDLRGNDEWAIDYYEKAAAVRPTRANVLMNLGLLYEDHGQYEKAVHAYERVRAGNPQNACAKMYLKDATASIAMYYDEAIERRHTRTAALLETPLSEFELSARCRSCLEKMNVRTLGDLTRLTEEEITTSKNFGETSLDELRQLLESKDLSFGTGRPEAAPSAEAIAPPSETGVLSKEVVEMALSVRALKCMRTLGIQTFGELIQKTEKEMLQCPNFGQTSLNEIKSKLQDCNLQLKD